MAISDLEIRVNFVHDVIILKWLEAFSTMSAFMAQRDVLFIRWKQFVHWQNVSGTTGVVGDKQTNGLQSNLWERNLNSEGNLRGSVLHSTTQCRFMEIFTGFK